MSNADLIKVAFFDVGRTLVGVDREWLQGAQETLAELRARHLRLGIISNTGQLSRVEILNRLPQNFDLGLFENELTIFSSEVGVEKPDPAIFQLAITRSGAEPGECLFCTEEAPHLLAAATLGMRTAQVNSQPGKGIGDLVKNLTVEGLLR